jgi:cytoskeleton protein RodZ
MLRAARDRAGWSEERMAAELRLPVARLQALELDDYSSFGPPVFVRGYLRRCATLLGIPASDVVAAYETAAGTAGRLEDIVALPPGRIPRPLPGWTGPLLSVAALAAVVAAGWWAFGLVTADRSSQVATAPRDLPAAGNAGSLALEVPTRRGGEPAATEPAATTAEVTVPAPHAGEPQRAARGP